MFHLQISLGVTLLIRFLDVYSHDNNYVISRHIIATMYAQYIFFKLVVEFKVHFLGNTHL